MVFSLALALLVLEIFKVKVETFFPISAYISFRVVNYKCFWWEFRIFDHSHRFLGLKNTYLDTKNSKIGLITPKLLKYPEIQIGYVRSQNPVSMVIYD